MSYSTLKPDETGITAGDSDTAPADALRGPYQVGTWQVEPESNSLFPAGEATQRRHIEPRLMHLLCYLAANPGRVLGRDELIAELWPRVVVNDNSLTRAVCELRKVLDSQVIRGKDYLQTIPKRGYRLTAPVRAGSRQSRCKNSGYTPTGVSPHPDPTGQLIRSNHFRKLRLAAVFLLVSLVGVVFNHTMIRGDAKPASMGNESLVFDRVTGSTVDFSGARMSPSSLGQGWDYPVNDSIAASSVISHDGTLEAFIGYEKGLSRIYLAPVGANVEPYPLFSSTDYLYRLQWSPVGNALLFARQRGGVQNAFLGNDSSAADLVMLDLDTMHLRTLMDNSPEPGDPASV